MYSPYKSAKEIAMYEDEDRVVPTNPTTVKLMNHINARFPIIAVRTYEAARVMGEIAAIAAGYNGGGKALLQWTVTRGLRQIDYSGERLEEVDISQPADFGLGDLKNYANPQGALKAAMSLAEDRPAILVVRNFHHYVNAHDVQQWLLDVADRFVETPHTLILLGSSVEFPRELSKAITIMEWPLPDAHELGEAVDAVADVVERRWQLPVAVENRNAIVRSLQGMTLEESHGAMAYLVSTQNRFDDSPDSIRILTDRKAEAIKQAAALEYWASDETMDNIGGLELLKEYGRVSAISYSEEAEAFGVQPPRGVLLVGLPGTGKSLTAKAIASEFGVPLVRMDMGAVFTGIVGGSEQRMRDALNTVEAVAPCVLMLDEIDKGGGGGGGERSDGGTGQRVLATLLTWMQERSRQAKVFCAMTANSIETINPALFRRADQFYVPLPGATAREQILRIHFAKNGRDPDALGIDVASIAADSKLTNYSGGELEEALLAAIREAFLLWRGEKDVTADLLVKALREIRPVAETMASELQRMIDWGATARQASAEDKPAKAVRVSSGARLPDR